MFLVSFGQDALLFSVVPVPLGDLIESHADFFCDFHFGCVVPDGVLIEVFKE